VPSLALPYPPLPRQHNSGAEGGRKARRKWGIGEPRSSRVYKLASIDLWVLRERQGDVDAATRKLADLQKRVADAQAKYERAKQVDYMRQAITQRDIAKKKEADLSSAQIDETWKNSALVFSKMEPLLKLTGNLFMECQGASNTLGVFVIKDLERPSQVPGPRKDF
jgi:hypothetical protein